MLNINMKLIINAYKRFINCKSQEYFKTLYSYQNFQLLNLSISIDFPTLSLDGGNLIKTLS